MTLLELFNQSGGSVSAPTGEILFGTGTGVTSSSLLKYRSEDQPLRVGRSGNASELVPSSRSLAYFTYDLALDDASYADAQVNSVEVHIGVEGDHNIYDLIAIDAYIENYANGNITHETTAIKFEYDLEGSGTIADFAYIRFIGGILDAHQTITKLFNIFAVDCLNTATYSYFLWFDAPGVFNIDANGAINHYNPAITKYVPGATIYEKIIQQWNDNVAEIGTQKGSTGTLRKVRLIGAGVEVKDGSTWKDIEAANFVLQGSAVRTNTTDAATGRLQAYDVDGAVYVDFITLTNGNTPTCVIKATDFKASDGTSGATFTITIPAVGTITVKNGLITASTLGA